MEETKKKAGRITMAALAVISVFMMCRIAFNFIDNNQRASDKDILIEGIYNTYAISQIENLDMELETLLGQEYYRSQEINKMPASIAKVDFLNYAYEEGWITLECQSKMNEYLPVSRLRLISIYEDGYFKPIVQKKETITRSEDTTVLRFYIELRFYDKSDDMVVRYKIDTWCDMTRKLVDGQWIIVDMEMEDILGKWEAR